MHIRHRITTGSGIIGILGQIIVLVISLWYAQDYYQNHIYPTRLVNEHFLETQCVLLDKDIVSSPQLTKEYRANFTLRYNVNGIPYTSIAHENGLDLAFRSSRYALELVSSQFETAQTYPCWYNPSLPSMVVLVRTDYSLIHVILPLIIALFMIVSLLKKIFQLFFLLSIIVSALKYKSK